MRKKLKGVVLFSMYSDDSFILEFGDEEHFKVGDRLYFTHNPFDGKMTIEIERKPDGEESPIVS